VPAVEPSLFKFVTTYAEGLAAGKISPNAKLKVTAPIIVFCQNFFLQFFENVVGKPITSIGTASKRVAATVMVTTKDTAPGEELALVQSFEELCDIYPDVLALGYGGSVASFAKFHERFIPRLLERIDAWAQTTTDDGLKSAAAESRERYEAALMAAQA
jgi:hypothetical protein